MSLIEKAAARLEQLKQSIGDEVTERDGDTAPQTARAEDKRSTLERAVDSRAFRDTTDVVPGKAPRVDAGVSTMPATATASRPEVTQTQADAGSAVLPEDRHIEIDLQALTDGGMVTPLAPRSPIAEEYRIIKRPVLRNVQGRTAGAMHNPNLIMVSSAMPGEGKSFTAINLAMSMAMELDHSVLLVDADVSRPSVLQRLGFARRQGLMDVLTGSSTLEQTILTTNVDKLRLLPAGFPNPRATELLASDVMVRLIEELANRYPDRVIVFDSPPLLITTESRELASHMGQVVMVVEANRATHANVRQSLNAIEHCPVRLLVLNKSTASRSSSYYGYSQGYGNYGYERITPLHADGA